MSIEIIKPGISDSIQDDGRYGYQHLGINPGGAMDLNAMGVANSLVGNKWNEPVIEFCFPAPKVAFKQATLIALGGADFGAVIDDRKIPINQPAVVPAGSELSFAKKVSGSYGYLAVYSGFELTKWLGSYSTNHRAKAGGFDGRSLKKGDILKPRKQIEDKKAQMVYPWRANVNDFYSKLPAYRCIPGNELPWFTKKSIREIEKSQFVISRASDRMGYRLKGELVSPRIRDELVSTAVSFGTIQAMPDGSLIVLTADHQTTGGYPRLAQLIAADRSSFVQCKPGEHICFAFITLKEAQKLMLQQHRSMMQVNRSCIINLRQYFQG